MTGTMTMGKLTEDDFVMIGEYLKKQFPVLNQAPEGAGEKASPYSEELMERVVRVEEELRHQRELMQQGFSMTEKRLDIMQHNMDNLQHNMEKRFEQTDKRFEQIDRRLDQMDKRFEQIDRRLDQMDKRFEQTDRTIAQMDKKIDLLAKEMDLRFDGMEKRLSMQTKILITTASLVISAMGVMAVLLK